MICLCFSNAFLDVKYLQSSGDMTSQVPTTTGRTTPPISIHFPSHTPPPGTSKHNPTRISRDAVGPPAAKTSQPPLASAYFPGQAKVS